jgi:AH receptor-interacting protein
MAYFCSVNASSPDNVKALFRRAKAHVGAWNPREAREDFTRVIELDHSLLATVRKELKQLEEMEKKKDEEDKSKLKGKIF